MMLAVLAGVVLAPLLYLPGYLIHVAWLGAGRPADALERHYERVTAGALLNGWLALTLAELGIFSAELHLALLAALCLICAALGWRRGGLRWPGGALGIVAARSRPPISAAGLRRWASVHGEALLFAGVALLFALLVARPFEVVLGSRDAGVYATTGFAIARTGTIVQHDRLVQQIANDQASPDAEIRAAAAQAETNLLGTQPASRYIATRLRFAGYLINQGDLPAGRITPQFFHLYPAWIALLASLLGLRGGLLATSLMGLLGVWSVGMLGRRLAGRSVGLLAMLFLALNGAQVWFSRYSTSEACAQFLSFAALYGFAAMSGARSQEPGDQEPEARSQKPVAAMAPAAALFSTHGFGALLAGVAAGQLALTRIDFFPVVLPIMLYLLYQALTKRWSRPLWVLALSLGAMLAQALLHILFISRAYFFDLIYARLQDQSAILANLALPFLTPALRQQFMDIPRSAPLRAPYRLPLEIGLLVALVLAFVLLRRDGRPQRAFERLALRYQRWLLGLAAAIVVLLGVYGYLIRPQILTAHRLASLPACVLPGPARGSAECLALQGYIGAPIEVAQHPNAIAYALDALPKLLGGQKVPSADAAEFSPGNPGESEKIGIAQANLVRVGWYLSPLGMLLAILGIALWCWRGLNRSSWLFLVAGLISTFFFVRLSYGTSDLTYIYILRRYVPLTYPALSLGMACAIVSLARWRPGGVRRLWSSVFRLSSFVFTATLVLFFLFTNRQLYQHVEYAGALAQLEAVARNFTPGDVLLFRGEGRDTPDLMATPLKYAFGLDTFAIRSTDPGKYANDLARYVQRWQAQGRQVYLVLGANGAVELPGLRPVPVGPATLDLPEFQQLRDQKPSLPQDFRFEFTIYRLEPAAVAAPPGAIAVDDYSAQLRGFYHPELLQGRMVAWTDGDALLRLAWPRDNAPLTLMVALAPGATRPATLGPARACLSILPAQSLALPADQLFTNQQCFELSNAAMTGYRYTIDPRGQPAPQSGTFLLRISSPNTWTPAEADPAQRDLRRLGVQFGGVQMSGP